MGCDSKIPVTVIVATRDEEARIARCLAALNDFNEVIVVDSNSCDRTQDIARAAGATVVNFAWDGRYPKKRQWCLDNLPTRHAMIFFVDADEVVTPELVSEIRAGGDADGYFIRGRYVINGRVLRFGITNNKLALFDKTKFVFPVVDDLDLPGMGEMEGHYQPVPRGPGVRIGRMRQALMHHAQDGWHERHERYAAWERGMNARNAWPADPVPVRQFLKRVFRGLPGRPLAAFLHSYVLKGGFLEGKEGFTLSLSRVWYYKLIGKKLLA